MADEMNRWERGRILCGAKVGMDRSSSASSRMKSDSGNLDLHALGCGSDHSDELDAPCSGEMDGLVEMDSRCRL
jgi:hypothetical protein